MLTGTTVSSKGQVSKSSSYIWLQRNGTAVTCLITSSKTLANFLIGRIQLDFRFNNNWRIRDSLSLEVHFATTVAVVLASPILAVFVARDAMCVDNTLIVSPGTLAWNAPMACHISRHGPAWTKKKRNASLWNESVGLTIFLNSRAVTRVV